MPKGYWIARVDVTDAEQYRAYIAANAAPLASHGKKFVRAGRYENPEGGARSRNVVIEFPSYQAALDCWHSPEYQAAVKLRAPASVTDMVIVEGYEGPQPGWRLGIALFALVAFEPRRAGARRERREYHAAHARQPRPWP